jgi:hypothetical protein
MLPATTCIAIAGHDACVRTRPYRIWLAIVTHGCRKHTGKVVALPRVGGLHHRYAMAV